MASIAERIETDYKVALKARDRLRIDTLRLIKAAMQRVAIDKRRQELSDEEIIQVLAQQAKQRRETIEAATQGQREDVLTQATEELALLKGYLPEPMSEDALSQLIDEALQSGGPNQGQIMKFVMSKAAGRADGKRVSALVAARLKQAPRT